MSALLSAWFNLRKGVRFMWYFSWILGMGLAVAFGLINVMWFESTHAFGGEKETEAQERFEKYSHKKDK
ncbi:MAG: cytochrome bd-I oxidase subunit CydX [Proteobacteria bacterium]|nr:cytochrome bd-I oxidase subunit CydX [Pseudomonadota bacterium]